jgi:hypothetical protein
MGRRARTGVSKTALYDALKTTKAQTAAAH